MDTLTIPYITDSMLIDYLTAPYGYRLRIWDDGTHDLAEASTLDASEVRGDRYDRNVISSVTCPGIQNLDRADFCTDFVELSAPLDAYVTVAPQQDAGRVVGSFADVVAECVRDGDVSGFRDELAEALERDLAD